MFGLLRAAVNTALRAIRSYTAPKPKSPPKPVSVFTRPAPPKIAAPPRPTFAPIANWGESRQSIQARTRAWAATPAARAQNTWIQQQNQRAAQLAAQRAAEARARAEAERIARIKREKQAALNGKIAAFTGSIKSAAAGAAAFLTGGKKAGAVTTKNHDGFGSLKEKEAFDKWFAKQTPEKQREVTEHNKIINEYADKARKNVDGHKKGLGGWFGGYFANQGGRSFAEQRAVEVSTKTSDRYKSRLDGFLKEQAKRGAALEAKRASGSLTQADIDAFRKWEGDNVKSLEYTRAATKGLLQGYGNKASEKLNDPVSRAGSWFNKHITRGLPGQFLGGVFNMSIGQGWQDVPSITTAGARVINTVNNLRNPTQTRNYHEGKTDRSRVTGLADAWKKSFNQRNFNWAQPSTGSDADFERWFKTRKADPKDKALYRRAYDAQIGNDRAANHTAEAFADPLLVVGKTGRAVSAVTKGSKATPWFSTASRAMSRLKNTKAGRAGSWLNAEHKPVSQRRHDFVMEELDDVAMKRPQVKKQLMKWQRNKTEIKAAEKVRIMEETTQQMSRAVADAGLPLTKKNTERFARAVQVVARGGSVDDVAAVGKLSLREKRVVTATAERMRGKLDEMYRAENAASLPRTNVTIDPTTGKKTFTRSKVAPVQYSYRQNYIPQYIGGFKASLEKRKPKKGSWWFTKEQKTQRIQSSDQLAKSLMARTYANTAARQNFPVQRNVVAGRADIHENLDRIENVDQYVGRTKWEKAMRVAGAPGRFWKKAVLLGNPAWYVNNELFNQMQGISAGGLRFLANQRGTGKYLEHVQRNAGARLLPSQADRMTRQIGSTLSKEVGGSKLARFATKQENRARVSLYRTFRQQGLSHDAAVKKVNDNLFDYTTKNWERPIKTVAPFYAWTKGLTKASVKMPLQKPKTALAFNEVDRNQQDQYDRDFDGVVPQLKELGYTDEQITEMRNYNRKYYANKLKVAGTDGTSTYMSTPFNAFSERGLSNMGFNPYMAALGETGDATDFYGQTVRGDQANLLARLISKFPQANLAAQGAAAWGVHSGKDKPAERWIGAKGSEGYGLTKEKQGYDRGKKNYSENMDPRRNMQQNVASFFGSPRFTLFDKNQLVESKKLQKIKDDYFALDTKDMKYADAEAARQKIFKKYGVTADEFYKGILAKYDTDHTKKIKGMKEDAAAKNKSLFEEYGRQPKGTRNLWATNKLRELTKAGYFDKNPFLKSFDWMSSESVGKADKQAAYQLAKSTGDWSAYNKTYGKSAGIRKKELYDEAVRTGDWSKWRKIYGSSKKAIAYEAAKKSGDWSAYRKQYGDSRKSSPHQFDGKFFKSAASMQKYKDGLFWKRYAAASRAERKALLEANPEYNTRQDWTQAQWDAENKRKKKEQRTKLRGWGNFATIEAAHLATNRSKSDAFLRSRRKKAPKVAFRLS